MSDDVDAVGHDPDDGDDDDLWRELRAAASRLDPVPPSALLAARSALAWRTIDAELAELSADSMGDADRLALVRGAGGPTLLTFDGPGLTVELEVQVADGGRRLLGQLVPPQRGLVQVRHRGGTATVPADQVGRFALGGVSPGPVSLRCETGGPSDARLVETDWFLA